jgi:hypothetical protein
MELSKNAEGCLVWLRAGFTPPLFLFIPVLLCAEQPAEGFARRLIAAVAEHKIDDGAFHQVALFD